jgi:2-polyprenyl-6-methoxyphenol hydroxylase-like FAD-dependent oxidoreductase
MSDLNQVPILIVGAGPTGLTMAIELARRGVLIRIVDKLVHPTEYSKALGIVPRTMETFEDMGIISSFLDRGKHLNCFNFHLEGKEIHYRLSALDSYYSFILSLPQGETEKILSNKLHELGVEVERGVRLETFSEKDGTIIASLQYSDGKEETIPFSWLIGCDGAKSTVRQVLGLQFEGETYSENFALADVSVVGEINTQEPHFFISDRGQFLVFPIPGGYERVIIVDMPVSTHFSVTPTLEEIQKIVDERSSIKLELKNPRWISPFQIHKRMTSAFRRGSAFVLGDAAHIHSPAGGQGMNTGIQDAYNLGWKLALVVKNQAPVALLESYQEERFPVVERVLSVTDQITNFMSKKGCFHRILRRVMASWILPRHFFRDKFIDRMSQLSIHYHKSSIVGQDRTSSAIALGLSPGDKAVDVDGVFFEGQPRKRLLELIAGRDHLLLLFAGENLMNEQLAELIAVAKEAKETYPGLLSTILVVKEDKLTALPDQLPEILIDPKFNLHERWGMQEPGYYLIRPDKYIGFRGKLPGKQLLYAYLERLFKTGFNL